MLIRDIWDKGNRMKKTLKDKLRELCHENYPGMVQIVYDNSQTDTYRTEWFYLREAPLMYLIDDLDSEIISEDLFNRCMDPEDQECQITVAG